MASTRTDEGGRDRARGREAAGGAVGRATAAHARRRQCWAGELLQRLGARDCDFSAATFVTVTLHSTAGALGVIEGISDALTGVAKLVAGPLANDESRRLRMASGGYVVTAAATGAIGVAPTVWQAGM